MAPLALRLSCPWLAQRPELPEEWRLNWTLGYFWGAGAWLAAWDRQNGTETAGRWGMRLDDADGVFNVRCRVCGLGAQPPMDEDCRPGHLKATLRFGPNALDGFVDESVVEGYVVFMVQTNCSAGGDVQSALSEPLAVIPKATQGDYTSSADQCGCQKERYSARVEVDFSVSMDAVKFMIVPNTTAGLLPIGVTTVAVPDMRMCSTTTTTATSTMTSTTVTTSSSQTVTRSSTTTTFRADQQKFLAGSLTLQVSSPEKFVKDPAAVTAVRAGVAALAGVPSSAVEVSLSLGARRLAAAAVARRLQDVPPVVVAYTIALDPQAIGRSPQSVVQSMSQATAQTASAALVAAVRATPGAGAYSVAVLEVAPPQEKVVTPGDGGGGSVDPTDQPTSGTTSTEEKGRDKSVDVAVGCVGAAAAVGVLGIVLYICYERHMAVVRRSKANAKAAGQMDDSARDQANMPFKPIYGPGGPNVAGEADLDSCTILDDEEDAKPFRLQLPKPVLGLPKERKVVVPTKGGKGSKKPVVPVLEPDDPNLIWDTRNLGDEAPTNVHPAIHSREPVEYFSAPHGRFMPGVMEVAFSVPLPKASAPPESPRVTYTVQLLLGEGKDPMRCSDVPLHSFRTPLAEGELVEVFSRSRGQWVRAVMDGSQEQSGSEGYTVKLADDGEIFKGVQPSRVRRLFPEGCPVMVYKGPSRGWAPALVDPVSVPLADWGGVPLDTPPWPRLDLGAPVVGHAKSDQSALGPKLEGRPPRENSPPPAGAKKPAAGSAGGQEEQPEPWCMVPIREMDSTTGSLVPSYLVRPVVESSNPFRAPLAADMLPWKDQEPGDNRSRL